jgi:hypothetical protein
LPAPNDPVAALKAKLGAGKGVRFSDVTSLVQDSEKTTFLRRTGKLQFGRSGIAASDITSDFKRHTGGILSYMHFAASGRTIWIGGTAYTTMGYEIPEGKKWVRDPLRMTGGMTALYSQVINPAEPATLKVLLKGRKQGRTYSGKITERALAKVSPWFRATSPLGADETVITYRLTLGRDNLPKTLVTSHPAASHVAEGVEVGDGVFSTETRYSGWGSRVRVSAPPRSQVAG